MPRYNLKEAFERVNVPLEFRKKISYIWLPIPVKYSFGGGANLWKRFYFSTNGHLARTDFLLAFAESSFVLNREEYSHLKRLKRLIAMNSYAESYALERLLKLERTTGELKYSTFLKHHIGKYERTRKGIEKLGKFYSLIHPYSTFKYKIYTKNLDLKKWSALVNKKKTTKK